MDMLAESQTLDPGEALRMYCDWLLARRTEEPFFKCVEKEVPQYEWYMIFYPLRTLLHGYRILGDKRYLEAALPCLDAYVSEQLPNGGFTSNFRQCPTSRLDKREFQEIVRQGRVNLADAGSNVAGLIQAAACAEGERKTRYLEAARRWFDEWATIWALPDGAYGNGIWYGHKINAPYTMAMSNVATAFSMFYRVTGESEYRTHAENCMRFQCQKHWLDDGRPVNLSVYPLPCEYAIDDYSRIFYLLEGLCWTHSVTEDVELKQLIESRLKAWVSGENGILSQWECGWFNFNSTDNFPHPGAWDNRLPILDETDEERVRRRKFLPSSRLGIRLFWELAKSCGIPHGLAYCARRVTADAKLAGIVEQAVQFLCTPRDARMAGVMSDTNRSYGAFAVQATGFAGLSLAEAIRPGSVFLDSENKFFP